MNIARRVAVAFVTVALGAVVVGAPAPAQAGTDTGWGGYVIKNR